MITWYNMFAEYTLCTEFTINPEFVVIHLKGVIVMPRKFVMPDPADRSQNEPAVILSPTQVLGLYNQATNGDKKSRIVDSVKDAVAKEAREAGWDEVEPIGNQMLLRKTWSDR